MSRDVARARKQGIMSVLVDEAWIHVTRGYSFLSSVASPTTSKTATTHDRSVNLSIPGSFERHMPDIAQWFAENPPKDAHLPVVCLHLRRLNHFHFEKSAFTVAVVHLVLVRP